MNSKKLFHGIDVEFAKGAKELTITGISSDSRIVAPGNLFIAKKGIEFDGARFIPQAIAAGATSVLTDIYNPFLENLTQIVYPNIDEIEAEIAARFYDRPSEKLFMVGITGTNGKTTISYLIKHLLEKEPNQCGLIGTIESIIGKHQFPTRLTTSDVVSNQRLLHEMVKEGCDSAVMEVSSHALDQNRVSLVEFDVGIFTNLSLDHLDYHTTMDAYAEAKGKLFKSLAEHKSAVINSDDPKADFFLKTVSCELMTYGIEKEADLRAFDIRLSLKSSEFSVEYQGQVYAAQTKLLGRFNVYNSLAAIAAALSRGLSMDEIIKKLSSFKTVPGRLEKVTEKNGTHVFVDYAHTAHALENVLETLSEIKEGRIITVFGCGGNRDQEKRLFL